MQKKTYILFFMLHFCISVVYSSVTHYNNQDTPQRKGMHWIIQDLAADTETFVSKELKIEYKHGPNSITSNKILTQFIERDLFNPDITSINQIQWRLKDTGFTKELLNDYLNAHKVAIKNLGKQKIALLLDDNSILSLTKTEATNRLINHLNIEANYNLIFR